MGEPKRLRHQRPRREPLMKPADVADLFDVEPVTVVEWAKTGKIRATRTPGGRWRFHPADVEALVAAPDRLADENEPAPVREHRDGPLMIPALTSPGRNTCATG